MSATLPPSWKAVLGDETGKPYFRNLMAFLEQERKSRQIFPSDEDLFAALRLTAYEDVKVVILGQDPYHDDGQAHGLCFSVKPPAKAPPSLKNIFKELHADLGCTAPDNGDLTPWTRQGVLLLNAVLTVAAHQPNSHKDRGWETFSDAVIGKVNEKTTPVVFCLWGSYARKKKALITGAQHVVIESAHPSPLSAHNGFFGSRPFSRANAALEAAGREPIDWQIPDR